MIEPIADSFICPFCQTSNPSHRKTEKIYALSFEKFFGTYLEGEEDRYPNLECLNNLFRTVPRDGIWGPSAFLVVAQRCSKCHKHSLIVRGIGSDLDFGEVMVWPKSSPIQFPDYVPKSIRKGYEEAHAIVDLSPNGCAAVSRRCLQGMIRDFCGIHESSLYKEIQALENHPELYALDQEVIHAIRKLGNVGAHPDKDPSLTVDVEPEEAKKMVKMLEVIIDSWYVRRHKKEELEKDLIATAASKRRP